MLDWFPIYDQASANLLLHLIILSIILPVKTQRLAGGQLHITALRESFFALLLVAGHPSTSCVQMAVLLIIFSSMSKSRGGVPNGWRRLRPIRSRERWRCLLSQSSLSPGSACQPGVRMRFSFSMKGENDHGTRKV